jgi:hypothetical protein
VQRGGDFKADLRQIKRAWSILSAGKIVMVQTSMKTRIPSHLSDTELVAEVRRFARGEREATAQLVAHLAELDKRELYKGAGFSSLFGYCCEVLHLSEHESYPRIEAARTARTFPVILDLRAMDPST